MKESGSVREDDLDETALALFATRANGLAVAAVEVIHVDESFVRESGSIDWQGYFSRRDVTEEVEFLLDDVADQVQHLTRVWRRASYLRRSPRRTAVARGRASSALRV